VTEQPRIAALFGAAIVLGQERGNMEALCALRDQGCEVLCLVRDEAWNTVVPAELDAVGLKWRKTAYMEQRMPGRMRWFLFRNPVAFVRANWDFLRVVREFKPTHVHAFNSVFILNFLPALMFSGLPMIYRAGDIPLRHNWFWRLVWRRVLRQTVQFVANSHYIAAQLIAAGVPADVIQVIYSHPARRGFAMKRFQPPAGSDGATVRFAYIGQIVPHKGPDVLVDAFRMITADAPQARLLIAGRISDWWSDAWARSLRERTQADPAISNKIAFLGYVEDIPALLDFCHVHVCPSIWDEPLANVVMEAKIAARPSIIFRSGGLPEVISDGLDGFICPQKTAHSLAKALQTYLNCPGVIQQQGFAATASLERLGVTRFADLWRAVYGPPR
jgi:glycosyltransferase involved in cell wall biosynthesis